MPPTVILIGDSIRMHYQAMVTERLADVAEIWGPKENGGTSANILEHLDEWAISKPAAVIHLNCGLHDLKREFDGPNTIPLDDYAANVETIFSRIKSETAATLIWA